MSARNVVPVQPECPEPSRRGSGHLRPGALRCFAALTGVVLAGCATSKEASSGVAVEGPQVQRSSGGGKQANPEANQPQINAHAKLLFEDANKAWEAQRKTKTFDYPALERKYQEAADADPNLAEAEYDLGVLADRQGKRDLAIQHYKRALDRKPTLKEAAENLAVIDQNAGQTQQAIKVYEQILTSYPDDASARARLAEIYREAGDPDRAIEMAKQALVRDPKTAAAYKVMMLANVDKHQLTMAKLVALRAMKLDDNDPELYHTMGLIFVEEKDPEKAIAQFKKAIEVRPDYLPSHVVLAKLAIQKEDWEDAEQHLRKLLQADGHNAGLHIDLGVAYKGMGQYDKALQEYEAAEKINPDLPAIYYNKGIILHRHKDAPEKGLELYKKFINMSGGALEASHPVYNLVNECQQLIAAKEQAKQMEEQAKKMEAEQKAKDEQAKADAAKQAADKAKAGAASDAAPKDQTKPDVKPAKGEVKAPAKSEPKEAAKAEADEAPAPKAEPKPEPKPRAKPEKKTAEKPAEAKTVPAKSTQPRNDEPLDDPL